MRQTGLVALLLLVSAGAVAHDGWTTSAAGCPNSGYDDTSNADWAQTASACAELGRRQRSIGAAMRAALIYEYFGRADLAREVLTPFEGSDEPMVLYTLAWADARLLHRKLALQEYRQAYDASGGVLDVRVRANATTLFAFELYRASRYEEAVRILNQLLAETAGKLPLMYERDARLALVRSLNEMGDARAAAAALEGLRAALGPVPMQSLELQEDAQLHIQRGQLRSADELLEEARAAARRDSSATEEVSSVIAQVGVASKESDWPRVRALSAELEKFEGPLPGDQRRALAALRGKAARAEGRLKEAQALFEEALGLSPPADERWSLLYDLGLTLRALGQLRPAQQAFEASIAEVELQRKQLLEPGSQAVLAGSREEPYDALFDLLAQEGDSGRALSTLQKSFAGRFDDDIAQLASSAGASVEDALDRRTAGRRLTEAAQGLDRQGETSQASDARFVAFVTADTRAWSLVRDGTQTHLEVVPLSPSDLCTLMQRFAQDFDDGTAKQLGDALFPATTLKRLGPRFSVILPACARAFPALALRVGQGRLVDHAVVTIAPDITTALARRQRAEPSSRSLVLADPRGDLPSARQDAEWTGRRTEAEVRLGPLASSSALDASGWRLLEFATHTAVDVAGPALVLADGNLSVTDILHRRLHGELVVLASCHSGSPLEATAADTLSTAFLRTGSRAVLATLHSVEDTFASRVVRDFYAQGGLDDPAGALARVQRALARSEPPSRWASFFVAGNPEPLRQPASSLRHAQALGR